MDANKFISTLTAYGADVEGAMSRFLDDTELYETCLNMFINDENFGLLESALREKRYTDAFSAAHTLKGVAANLGLEPILGVISGIVEPLRRGEYGDDLPAKCAGLLAKRESLRVLFK